MSNTAAQPTTDDLFGIAIDAMSSQGFDPIGDVTACRPNLPAVAVKTIEYFERRGGWEAVRTDLVGAGALVFAKATDDGCYVMHTTLSGCISAEARFDLAPIGVRMFAAALTV